MKKIYSVVLIALAAIPFMQSCDNSDGDYPSFVSIATLKADAESKSFYFQLDNDKKMYAGDKSRVGYYDIMDDDGNSKDGKRTIIYYNLLDQKVEGFEYNAELYSIVDVLTKDIESAQDAEQLETFGDDKIDIEDAWISGEWINIQYAFQTTGSKSHKISLIYNATASAPEDMPDGYTYLEFRQFADGDTSGSLYRNYVSYKLGTYNPEPAGGKGLYIRVNGINGKVSYTKVDIRKSESTAAKNITKTTQNSQAAF